MNTKRLMVLCAVVVGLFCIRSGNAYGDWIGDLDSTAVLQFPLNDDLDTLGREATADSAIAVLMYESGAVGIVSTWSAKTTANGANNWWQTDSLTRVSVPMYWFRDNVRNWMEIDVAPTPDTMKPGRYSLSVYLFRKQGSVTVRSQTNASWNLLRYNGTPKIKAIQYADIERIQRDSTTANRIVDMLDGDVNGPVMSLDRLTINATTSNPGIVVNGGTSGIVVNGLTGSGVDIFGGSNATGAPNGTNAVRLISQAEQGFGLTIGGNATDYGGMYLYGSGFSPFHAHVDGGSNAAMFLENHGSGPGLEAWGMCASVNDTALGWGAIFRGGYSNGTGTVPGTGGIKVIGYGTQPAIMIQQDSVRNAIEILGGKTGVGGSALYAAGRAGNNDAVVIAGVGTGDGIDVTGGSSGSSAAGINAKGGAGNGPGIVATGGGSTGTGVVAQGAASGTAMTITGGATSGKGIYIRALGGNNSGIEVEGLGTKSALSLTGGTNAPGMIVSAGGGTNSGLLITGSSADGINSSITGNITGNLIGSVTKSVPDSVRNRGWLTGTTAAVTTDSAFISRQQKRIWGQKGGTSDTDTLTTAQRYVTTAGGTVPSAAEISDSVWGNRLSEFSADTVYGGMVKKLRDTLSILLHLSGYTAPPAAAVVADSVWGDRLAEFSADTIYGGMVKKIRDTLSVLTHGKTGYTLASDGLTNDTMATRIKADTKALRDSLQYMMKLKTVTDSNLARYVVRTDYQGGSGTGNDSLQIRRWVWDSTSSKYIQGGIVYHRVVDSNKTELSGSGTANWGDTLKVFANQLDSLRDSTRVLMHTKTITDSNFARLATHLTYRDSVQTKAVRDSLQYVMMQKTVTDSNLARLVTHLTYRDSVQTKAIRDSLQYLTGGGGSSNWSNAQRDSLLNLAVIGNVARTSDVTGACGSGTGAQTLTVTLLDTSGTPSVVPSANVTVQNIAQSANLWIGKTGSLGTAAGNNSISTPIAIVAYLPGYTFPVFKDTTGAGATFADTVRGYNIDIGSPTTANLKRVYGYEYSGGDSLEGLQVVATLMTPPATDSTIIDISTHVQYSASMEIGAWTNTAGKWQIDLPLNTNIQPAGSRWKLTCYDSRGGTRWSVTVNLTTVTTDCLLHITNGATCP